MLLGSLYDTLAALLFLLLDFPPIHDGGVGLVDVVALSHANQGIVSIVLFKIDDLVLSVICFFLNDLEVINNMTSLVLRLFNFLPLLTALVFSKVSFPLNAKV